MIIKKDDLISEISKRMNLHKYSIKEVLECLEDVINDNLSKANCDEDVEIKLFKGMKLKSKLIPSHSGINPKTNEVITIDDKINVSCKITDYHKRKLK